MEFTREIYWNVGHGAGTLIPMYALAIGAMVVVAIKFLCDSIRKASILQIKM